MPDESSLQFLGEGLILEIFGPKSLLGVATGQGGAVRLFFSEVPGSLKA